MTDSFFITCTDSEQYPGKKVLHITLWFDNLDVSESDRLIQEFRAKANSEVS